MSDPINQIIDLILKSNKILITPSSPPDGDSIGSALALFEGLKKLDKSVTVVCADPVPESLQFLPGSSNISDAISDNKDFIVTLDCNEAQVDKLKYEIVDNKVNIIITPKNGEFSEKHVTFNKSGPYFDLVIAVDTADTKQLGKIYEDNTEFFYNVPIINIDHHISNINFGKINYVDSAASSATEILFEIFKALEEKTQKRLVDGKVATYLLTGILTDTGSYQNPNTTPKSLEVSAELVERGASQQEIVKHVFRTKNLTTLKLWGEVLSKIETDDQHKIVWSTMTKSDLAKTDAKIEEISGLIDDMLINAPGAEIVFIIKEDEGRVSCSMRSTTPAANVSDIAEHFGGGGHVQAAGFKLIGKEYQEAVKEIINYIKQYQAERLNITSAQEIKPQASRAPKSVVETTPATPQSPKVPTPPHKRDESAGYIDKVNQHLLGTEEPKQTAQPAVQPAEGSEQSRGVPPPKPPEPPKDPVATEGPKPASSRNRRRRKRRSEARQPGPTQQTPPQVQKPPREARPASQSVQPPRPPEPPKPTFVEPPAPTPIPKPPAQEQQVTPEPPTHTQPPAAPAPNVPPAQPVQPVAPVAPAPQPTQPATSPKPPEPPKPTFDPFNPPSPDESDILSALDKL